MNHSNGISKMPVIISFLLINFLLIVLFFYQKYVSNDHSIDLLMQILIAILSTFSGLSLSLFFSKKHDYELENIRLNNIYIGWLKIIYSELDYNNKNLYLLLEGINTFPIPKSLNDIKKLHSVFLSIIKVSDGFKSQALNSLMASGDFVEISTTDTFFNSIQQAYFNIDLLKSRLEVSHVAFIDYPTMNDEELKIIYPSVVNILEETKKQILNNCQFNSNAKQVISKFLNSKGITFSNNSTIPR